PAPPHIYPLSLHDALPISLGARASGVRAAPTMRLPILMYHKVDRPPPPPGARYLRNYVLPEQFDAQLAALRRWGYETISFADWLDRKSTRLNSSHVAISYA